MKFFAVILLLAATTAIAQDTHTATPATDPAAQNSAVSTQPQRQLFTFTDVEQKELMVAKLTVELQQAKKALKTARTQAKEAHPVTQVIDSLTRRYNLPQGVKFQQQPDGQIVAVKDR